LPAEHSIPICSLQRHNRLTTGERTCTKRASAGLSFAGYSVPEQRGEHARRACACAESMRGSALPAARGAPRTVMHAAWWSHRTLQHGLGLLVAPHASTRARPHSRLGRSLLSAPAIALFGCNTGSVRFIRLQDGLGLLHVCTIVADSDWTWMRTRTRTRPMVSRSVLSALALSSRGAQRVLHSPAEARSSSRIPFARESIKSNS
jgi:hypothetical protein